MGHSRNHELPRGQEPVSEEHEPHITDVRPSSVPGGPSWAPGRTLLRGRFVIERQLGQGGTGTVYRAYDEVRGAPVALKVLHARDAAGLSALKHEFRVRRDVVHPNLVRLFELFSDDKTSFFTMDLVEGLPFHKAVRGPGSVVNQTKLASALKQLVQVVLELHERGTLHRDIKSDNVLIRPDDTVVLLDFGLALDLARVSSDRLEPSARFVQGTPGYLAPELALGKSASEKSDAYAIGALVYECLTGWLPRHSETGRTLLTRAVELPSELVPGIHPVLRRVCLGLLETEPELRLGLREALELLGGSRVAPSPPTQLLGRSHELRLLEEAFADFTRSGAPRAAFISGPSGVGKSALLSAFLDRVEPEALVLRGRCHEREAIPYKAFDEIVDALVAGLSELPPEEVFELLHPAEALTLLRVFPAIGQLSVFEGFAEEEADAADPRQIRTQAYLAITQLLARLARVRPLILFIDDAQWGDRDSAFLLQELVAASEPPHCLYVLVHRDVTEGPGEFLAALSTGTRKLEDSLPTLRIALQALDDAQSLELATALLPPGPQRDVQASFVCREAKGSPLLIVELARHLGAWGGGATTDLAQELSLVDVVLARLAPIPSQGRAAFEAICVSGSPVSEAVIADVVGCSDLSREVVALAAHRLIRERTATAPDALVPFHDGIREAFLRTLSEQHQAGLHLRLAHAHEKQGVREAEAIARHYAAAGHQNRASRWAEIAGDSAAAALAFDRAAGWFKMALWAAEDGHAALIQIKLAHALADAGRGKEAAPVFLKAAEGAEPRIALELRRRAAEQWLVTGRVEEGRRILEQVFRDAKLSFPRSERRALFQLSVLRLGLRLRGSTPRRPRGAASETDLLRIDACRAAWPISFVSTVHAAALQARFLSLALRSGDPYRLALGLGMEAVQRSIDGGKERGPAETLRLQALELTEQLDNPHATAFLDFVDGHIGYMCGEWTRARRALEPAEQRLSQRCRSATWELNSTRFFWGNALYHLGELTEFQSRVLGWLSDAEERQDEYAQAGFRLMRARAVLYLEGDAALGQKLVQQALEEWPQKALGVHGFMATLLEIQIHLSQGHDGRALSTALGLERRFFRSLMSRIQLCRVHVRAHVALSALAVASSARAPGPALRLAEKNARRLEREGVPWAAAQAAYVRATLLALRGSSDAGAALDAASSKLEASEMPLSAAAAKWRQLALLGRDTDEAKRRFTERHVTRPEMVLRMLAPGWERPDRPLLT